MATAVATEDSHLDVIVEEIIEVFDKLLSEIKSRRDELLAQVHEKRREFESNNASIVESIRELEEMRAQIEKMSVRQNLAVKKQQDSLADIDSEIERLNIGLSNNSELKFNCSLNQLIERVKQFGNVVDHSSITAKYKSKLTPAHVITGSQIGTISNSIHLHIDNEQQLLYLLNSNLHVLYRGQSADMTRISVFNANDFTLIRTIKFDEVYITFMAIGNEFIYVGSSHKLMRYKESNYSLLNKCQMDNSTYICEICFTSENQVIVLCNRDRNYIFRVYDRAINYIGEIELGLQYPKKIRCDYLISTFVSSEQFYIQSRDKLLVFNKKGDNIDSVEFNKEGMCIVSLFVCLFTISICVIQGNQPY